MARQDQNLLETLVSPLSDSPTSRQEKTSTHRPYYPPQVSLVGQAKRLMAGEPFAALKDSDGWFKSK
ncbi:MAG: hypothetical protein E6J34_16750 [Chloroflexi bacterium]|nr:MAG: hypothetical protein E6J34_16750 [Chloroflexota bacterium]